MSICKQELWAPWYREDDCAFHQKDGSMSIHENECNRSLWGEEFHRDGHDRCGATIWSPSVNGHFVEDRAFSLYAM